MVEKAILTLLTDTSAGQRIYPLVLPFKVAFPALTYQRISNTGHHDIDIEHPRVQFTAWSDKLITARQLAGEVEDRLRRYKGVIDGYRITNVNSFPGDLLTGKQDAGMFYIG